MNNYLQKCSSLMTVLIVIFGTSWPLIVSAQEIMLDQVREAGTLLVFPVYGDDKSYHYLPDKVRLGRNDDGNPEFAFIKFVKNAGDMTASSAGVNQTKDAGGLVTFTVFLDASDEEKRQAQQELSKAVPGARLVGPIAYKSGTFVVLSSFIENDRFTEKVVGFGSAPIFPGHKAAVSMELTAEGATILWESFGMESSQISVGFEMVIEGYRNAYEGSIEVDSSKFARNQRIAGGMKLGSMLGIDIDIAMKEVKESGGIKIVEKGKSDAGQEFTKSAYNKILQNYFSPASADPVFMATLQDDPNMYSNFDKAAEFNRTERSRIREENREGQRDYERQMQVAQQAISNAEQRGEYLPILDMLPLGDAQAEGDNTPGSGGQFEGNGTTGSRSQPATASQAFGPPEGETGPDFSLVMAYHLKSYSLQQDFKYSITQYEQDTKSLRFDQPIGGTDIKSRRDDPNYFLVVNEDDPAYMQRQVRVSIAGQNARDFGKWVNNVVVQLNKKHQDGTETFKEIIIDKNKFADTANNFMMVYGNSGAKRERNWANYEYTAIWSLGGGVNWNSGPIPSNSAMINIAPPHRYREITVKGNQRVMEDLGVRSVDVKFFSEFMGEQLHDELSFEIGEGPASQKIQYAFENGKSSAYQYEIVWRLRDNKRLESGRLKSDDTRIYIDELPE